MITAHLINRKGKYLGHIPLASCILLVRYDGQYFVRDEPSVDGYWYKASDLLHVADIEPARKLP